MDNDFEQNHYSKTAFGTYTVRHNSLCLIEWVDNYSENINYFDLKAKVLSCLKEMS